MLTVPLHGRKAAGRIALIDDADFTRVQPFRWLVWEYPNPSGRLAGPYAYAHDRRPDGRRTTVKMHQLISGYRKVDHVNGNGLDNQRVNLRDGSDGVNERNARKRIDGSSQFKGVSRDRQAGRWRARIQFNGKTRFLGNFTEEADAAVAYDAAAREMFGVAAWLNFPA